MRTKEELIREVEDRNKLRAEVGLTFVSVAEEVMKLQKLEQEAEFRREYRAWLDRNPGLQERIEAEELEKERRERGEPTWKPRALLNGAWAFGSRVSERMHALSREQRQVAGESD